MVPHPTLLLVELRWMRHGGKAMSAAADAEDGRVTGATAWVLA